MKIGTVRVNLRRVDTGAVLGENMLSGNVLGRRGKDGGWRLVLPFLFVLAY